MNDEADKQYLVSDENIRDLERRYQIAKGALPEVMNAGSYGYRYPEDISRFMSDLFFVPWCEVTRFEDFSDFQEILRRIERANFEDCCRALISAGKLEKYGHGQWFYILDEDLIQPIIERLKDLKKDSAEQLN